MYICILRSRVCARMLYTIYIFENIIHPSINKTPTPAAQRLTPTEWNPLDQPQSGRSVMRERERETGADISI